MQPLTGQVLPRKGLFLNDLQQLCYAYIYIYMCMYMYISMYMYIYMYIYLFGIGGMGMGMEENQETSLYVRFSCDRRE